MFPYLFRRGTSDDTQNTVLETIFVASISLLSLMLVAVAILHCIVRRRRRQASSNWTSRRTLCVITPQSENGPEWEVYVLELSPASARDVEKALQKSSLGGSNSQHSQFSPFSAGPQPVPPAVLQSGTPTRLDTSESAPVCSSNAKVDAQSQGPIAFYANSESHPPVAHE